MTWTLVFQICTLVVVCGLILGLVVESTIKAIKGK
jgi:hypothetical protein